MDKNTTYCYSEIDVYHEMMLYNSCQVPSEDGIFEEYHLVLNGDKQECVICFEKEGHVR